MTNQLDNQTSYTLSFGDITKRPPMTMFRGLKILVFLTISTCMLSAQGSSSATQTLTLEVKPVTKIAVSGNPGALVIHDAAAGSQLTSVRDENTSYSVTSNLENMKIVASINNGMPTGTQLMIRLGSSSGNSLGDINISNATLPVDVVTGIGKGIDRNQSIGYVFAANADVGEIVSDTRVVTLTLTN